MVLKNTSVLLASLGIFYTVTISQSFGQGSITVDGTRLNQSMMTMKTFGGRPEGGSTRVAYSEANKEALAYLDGLMRDAGLVTHIDVAGNLVGRQDGSDSSLAPIVMGSHIDTVPNGGHYDGIVGVMSAVEVATTLHERNVMLRHPTEFIVWANEEAGKIGSRALVGAIKQSEFALAALGDRRIGEGTRFLGGNPDKLHRAIRGKGDIAAYLELHIEQGAILDQKGIAIGVVEGIVGIRRWNVFVDGTANHAGTTPMDQRSDALYTAAQFITLVREVITATPGTQVGTVGRIEAFPGAPNVVPGQATMSLEIRDLSMQKVIALFEKIEAASESLAKKNQVTIRFEQFYESLAAPTNETIRQLIETSTDSLGLSHQRMPSGAGHDAQSLAPICPIGMIFVPSRNGISHAPEEFTSPKQITNGANVLLRTLLGLDSSFD